MEIAEKITLPQIVNERIKQFIIENGLISGDKLPSEKQLTDMLKVSRNVVREALRSLETLGILRIRGGGGIYVDVPSLKPFMDQISFQWSTNEQKLKELIETRRVLEIGAVEMAIKNYNTDLLRDMDVAIEQMEQCLVDHESPIAADLAFHRALFKATGNQTYFELSDLLSQFFYQLRVRHFEVPSSTAISLEQHKQIVTQIRLKNVDEAKVCMNVHLITLDALIQK